MTGLFPDAEAVMCDLLTPLAPTATFLSEGWVDTLPVIQVNRVGGGADSITDIARLQVAVFAGTRAAAWQLANQVRQTVLTAGNTRVGGVLIDSASESTAGQQIPDIDPDDKRVISTYQLAFRRHFA